MFGQLNWSTLQRSNINEELLILLTFVLKRQRDRQPAAYYFRNEVLS